MNIWWLSQGDLEGLSEMTPLPDYIEREVLSMMGRPLRGRLWVASELGKVEVSKEQFMTSPLAWRLIRCGGVVIRALDAAQLRSWPGIVTDLNLVRA